MKAIDNQIRNISSSHQDKHSDKVNSHQHHGKVDKTHRAKIVEFDKLDNDSQIDNDFGLHIIYFLQHGHWKDVYKRQVLSMSDFSFFNRR